MCNASTGAGGTQFSFAASAPVPALPPAPAPAPAPALAVAAAIVGVCKAVGQKPVCVCGHDTVTPSDVSNCGKGFVLNQTCSDNKKDRPVYELL